MRLLLVLLLFLVSCSAGRVTTPNTNNSKKHFKAIKVDKPVEHKCPEIHK